MTRYQQEMAFLSDIVVTVTHHAKEFFINVLNVDPQKIFTIHNGSSIPNKTGKFKLRKNMVFPSLIKLWFSQGGLPKIRDSRF